jgi:predicted dehydrogenase
MIEKPLALSLRDCEKLQGFKPLILVNHIHLFSEGYQHIKRILGLEKIDTIQTFGWGTSLPRSYSQLWDYGPHDLSMVLDLLKKDPVKIHCSKDNHYYVSMEFENKHKSSTNTTSVIGQETSLERKRKICLSFSGLDLVYDDFYRPSWHSPPLKNAIQAFIDGLDGREDERFGLDLSFKIIKILETCDKILNI